jgi:hypothetical protein
MELTYDWQAFHEVFTRPRSASPASGQPTGPVFAVLHDGAVVAAYAENEDLSDWIGAASSEIATGLGHRELRFYDRSKADAWIAEALALPHAYEQRSFLARKAVPEPRTGDSSRKLSVVGPKLHFLLEAVEGWWGKLLPSAYGLLIRLEGQSTGREAGSLLVVVRRGRIESFQEPDLGPMGAERAKQPAEVIKYLSEKHLVPVQGLFVPAHEWREWSESPKPWVKLAAAVRANRARLVPFRWFLVTLMATRAFLRL